MTHRFSVDRRQVELVPHDPMWAAQAGAESLSLAAAIGATLVLIEHVGSTAIPGILAKPTIDLMPIVGSLEELDARRAELEGLGYVWRGEWGVRGRRYCVREQDGRRLFHVHCLGAGNPEIARMLMFRDYLRANLEEARAYEAAKRAAAAAQPDDTLAYNAHKQAWLLTCRSRAEAWARSLEPGGG